MEFSDSDLSDDFYQPPKSKRQDSSKKEQCETSSSEDNPEAPSEKNEKSDGETKPDKLKQTPTFKCQYCCLAFTFKSNCSRHEKNCSVNPEKERFSQICPNCNSVFQRKYRLKKHLTKCSTQSPTPSCSKKKTPCLLKGCEQEFYHKSSLIEHLQSEHSNDVSIKPLVVKNFASIQEFNDWKEKEEETTFSYFTRKKGETAQSSVKHFYCQHDGSSKVHSQRKTSRCNRKGRVKVGHHCISKMKVTVSETKSVNVEYYPTHNHLCKYEDFVHHPLPDKMSRFIDRKLAEKIPPTVVYEMTKELFLPKKNTPNVHEIKANILTKKRVLERGRRKRMARRLHKDDAKAVYLMVTQMLDSEDASSILIYKPYGSTVVHGPPEIDQLPNSSELFMFAMQTQRQVDLMKNHCGRIVLLDETHGTNQYKYQLLTAMVVDENNRGWPVAHLITSQSDAKTLRYFFQCLKSRLGEDSVNCVITDDDPALINGMNEGFSEDLRHILCIWHVLKNFKDNLRAKVSRDLFDSMLSEVRVIMNEENEALFLKLVDGFKKKYEDNKDASKFIDYFKKYYLNRPQKWALCYRHFPHGGVNTTGHLESFHHRLKKTYLKRKVNKRLDDIISILFELEWDDYCTRCRIASTGITTSPQEILERHQRGLSMKDDCIVEQALNRLWEIKSASGNKTSYLVVQMKETCSADLCFSRCTKPECHGLCAHMFSCSCPDKHPLCKHIHKLQSFITRGQPCVQLEEPDFYVLPNHKTHEDLIIEDAEESHNYQDEENTSGERKWNSMTEDIRVNLKLLEDFVMAADRKQVSENSLTHVHSVVSDLVKSLDTLSLENNDIPEMIPCVKFAPNEKLKTQLSQLSSFKRPAKRKKKCDPAALCQKKKAALEGLLQCHGEEAAQTECDDNVSERSHESDGEVDVDKTFTLHASYVEDPTDIILTCGTEKISLIHLKSLELSLPGYEEKQLMERDSAFKVGWLYCSIIDVFLYKLSKVTEHVLCLSCDIATRASIGRSNEDIIKKKLNGSSSNVSIILMPANLTGDHWVILVVFLKQQEICYYDPLHQPISQRCLLLMKQTVSDLKLIFPLSVWKIKVEKFIKQTDGVNCGALICQFAKHTIERPENPVVCSPSEFRKIMYCTIVGKCLRRSKFSDESCGECGISFANDLTLKVWVCCVQCHQWFHENCIHDPDFLNGTSEFVCP